MSTFAEKCLAGLAIAFVAVLGAPFLYAAGILIAFVLAILTSIPLYYLWNSLAPTYFGFLPAVWLKIPFWDLVWLTWCLGIVKHIIFPRATATATANNKND